VAGKDPISASLLNGEALHLMDNADLRLAYDRIGEGNPFVLLHAGIADRRMWRPQVESLSAKFELISVDLRGFGGSPPASGSYAHHIDLVNLLDHLGIQRAGVIGASFGGEVALRFALTYPDRTVALALIATRAGAIRPSNEVIQVWDDADAAFARGDIESAVEIELRAWVDGPYRTPEAVDQATREFVREMNLAVWQRGVQEESAPETAFTPMARERLHEVTMPVLLLSGALDQADVTRSMGYLAAKIPNARTVTIEHTAHLPTLERPQPCNVELASFFSAAFSEAK
jgi:3-oxoadipate enol-lactonase